MNKIAVIGGGAGGLAAAVFIKSESKEYSVTVFERMDRTGKKLLATGNGRCNLSNVSVGATVKYNGVTLPEHYFGNDPAFALSALKRFGIDDLRAWFLSLGMPTVFEEDKLFPRSLCASTVLDMLRLNCEKLGVVFKLNSAVDKIITDKKGFIINGEHFDNVIVAAGGRSQESLGSNGSGYKLLCDFGHKLTKTFPSITQVKTDTTFTKPLKGIKADAACKITVDKKTVRKEFGQVLFTDYGLSGPPIFSLSRIASEYGDRCNVSLDLMSDYSFGEVCGLIENIVKNPFCNDMTLENLLTPLMVKRLGQTVVKSCGYKLGTPVNTLRPADIKTIAGGIKSFSHKVTGVQGYNVAQVTAGGILTRDFDSKTMQSKLKKGLYAIGEVLDIDGDCGGYNLQWAFSSAYCAAKSITEGAK